MTAIYPCVIWSFEHEAWWGPNRWGYTPDLAQAGRYSEADAAAIVAAANVVRRNEAWLTLVDAHEFGPPKDEGDL